MIIAHITGGMGNQMFMYAAGLAVATRLNTTLRLNPCENYASLYRPYCLSCFPAITERDAAFRETLRISPGNAVLYTLPQPLVSRYRIAGKIYNRILKYISKDLKRTMYYSGNIYIPQRSCIYSRDFELIQDNTYMRGYWESEKFFSGISDLVRSKFRFAQDCFNPELSVKIRSCNSVAIHVRRGDKVNNSGVKASDERYIRAAAEKISSLTDKPSFFVFSDDIEWCRENLPQIYDTEYTFIDGQTPPQDMALMTICRHIIAAPSTFSWWGAWLNDNPGKIVIAPDVNLWYTDTKGREDLLPESWIKIG